MEPEKYPTVYSEKKFCDCGKKVRNRTEGFGEGLKKYIYCYCSSCGKRWKYEKRQQKRKGWV